MLISKIMALLISVGGFCFMVLGYDYLIRRKYVMSIMTALTGLGSIFTAIQYVLS